MLRRTFLTTAAGAAVSVPLPGFAAPPATDRLIDTNVTLGDWAVRPSWARTPALLVARLRRHGVTQAWVSHIDGVLHTDMDSVNVRLMETCAREGEGVLIPFGTVNPTFPDWEEDVRRCAEIHRMAGIRLYPNYHGYTLDDPRFAHLLELAANRRLLVQISLTIEDDRSQNPVLTAPPVQAAALVELLPRFPAARVMLLNSTSRVLGANLPLLQKLSSVGVRFEIATLEGVAGLESLLQRVPGIRVCFGSHSPYFYFESALLKLSESQLSPEQLESVCHREARTTLFPA